MIMAVILALVLAGWVHYRLGLQIASTGQRWAARAMLVVVGISFGWAMSQVYVDSHGLAAAWVFLTSFGMVHLPAAIILWLKKQRSRQTQESQDRRKKQAD